MIRPLDPSASSALESGSAIDRPIDLADRHIHFVGIGGCGMSGLARMVRQIGGICTGTDRSDSEAIVALRKSGIPVALTQSTDSVPEACDMLIVSAAIPADHPEVVEARRRGVAVVKYAHLLGQLMRGRTGVAIAGTHGKSSTTSMTSHILIESGLDPSLIVGANCAQIGGGWRVGKSDLLIVEACEFDRSFHSYHPTHAVILNVEEDHLDMYKSLDEIVESFAIFARRLPEHGSLLIQHEMPHRLAITAKVDCKVETIGFNPQADWRVEVIPVGPALMPGVVAAAQCSVSLAPIVKLYHHKTLVATWRNPLPGEHMAYNAAAAMITAHRLGATWEQAFAAVAEFKGLDRRMQRLGQRLAPMVADQQRMSVVAPVTVVDDYGHHPTEIDTTLRALRGHYNPRRLICVFQPHQHSRTRFLMEQFAVSFSEADMVLVPEIYFVRDSEAERQAVTAQDLVDQLARREIDARFIDGIDAITDHLLEVTRPGDLVVTMGAGDVWKVALAYLNRTMVWQPD